MKLHNILVEMESRIPVEVTVEREEKSDAPEAENGWILRAIVIRGHLLVHRDPFGTGDSPTEYEFIPNEAIYQETGQPFDINLLNKAEWDYVESQAIAQM